MYILHAADRTEKITINFDIRRITNSLFLYIMPAYNSTAEPTLSCSIRVRYKMLMIG